MDAVPVVLVVDDECLIADTLAEILNQSGYPSLAAYSAEEALDASLDHPPLMLITDVMLPEMNGIDLAIKMKRIYPDLEIILFSGQAATPDLIASAKAAGHDFVLLAKPVHPRDLIARVAGRVKPSSSEVSSS